MRSPDFTGGAAYVRSQNLKPVRYDVLLKRLECVYRIYDPGIRCSFTAFVGCVHVTMSQRNTQQAILVPWYKRFYYLVILTWPEKYVRRTIRTWFYCLQSLGFCAFGGPISSRLISDFSGFSWLSPRALRSPNTFTDEIRF